MKNVSVILIHEGAPDRMKQAARRVIDSSLLKAGSVEGRFQEAQSIYNRMMGIKTTTHGYAVEETDDPASKIPDMPVSEAALYQRRQEEKVLHSMASTLAGGIADGVAKALSSRLETVDKPQVETPKKVSPAKKRTSL